MASWKKALEASFIMVPLSLSSRNQSLNRLQIIASHHTRPCVNVCQRQTLASPAHCLHQGKSLPHVGFNVCSLGVSLRFDRQFWRTGTLTMLFQALNRVLLYAWLRETITNSAWSSGLALTYKCPYYCPSMLFCGLKNGPGFIEAITIATFVDSGPIGKGLIDGVL